MNDPKKCFVIMPISNCDGYVEGHFDEVYEELIKQACMKAGFEPVRADEVNTTHSIKMDILKKIATFDMVVCDISARNPNVLYELGIRHALNKPVSIIKDDKTDRIFDIDDIRWISYDKDLRISSIRPKISELAENIKNTFNDQSESLFNFALNQGHGAPKNSFNSQKDKQRFPKMIHGHVAHWNTDKEVGVIKSGDDEYFFHTGCCVINKAPKTGDAVYFYEKDLGGRNLTAVCIVSIGDRLSGKVVGINKFKKFAFVKVEDPHGNEATIYTPMLDSYGQLKKNQELVFTIATNNTGVCAVDAVPSSE